MTIIVIGAGYVKRFSAAAGETLSLKAGYMAGFLRIVYSNVGVKSTDKAIIFHVLVAFISLSLSFFSFDITSSKIYSIEYGSA